jgi:cytidylate kinase
MGHIRAKKRAHVSDRLIIAISGLPGTGKTTAAHALAMHLGGTFLSFGGYVRELVKARGFAPDRATLQTIGDGAVSADPQAFLEGVLANVASDWTHLIIEGVRHASILAELRKFAVREGAVLKLVHLYTAEPTRLRRLKVRGESAEIAIAATSHASERDALSVLPRDADFCFDTTNTDEPAVNEILTAIGA